MKALIGVLALVVAMALPSATAGAQPAFKASDSVKQVTVYGWGRYFKNTPTAVLTAHVKQIVTSDDATYILKKNGTVLAFGLGSDGELGDGKKQSSTTPVRVDVPPIASLANPMPYNTAMAITSTGQVYGWGANNSHELCGTGTDISTPIRLSNLTDVAQATGAGGHALYLLTNGTLEGCGGNHYGELGNGTTTDTTDPVTVTGLPAPVKTLTSSWQGSGALLTDHTYWNWGFNADDQLGYAGSYSDVPVKVAGSFSQVFQGGSGPTNGQTLALTTGKQVEAWGSDDWGQLCDGQQTSAVLPEIVTSVSDVQNVVSGGWTSYLTDSSGDLWVCGENQYGQAGVPGENPVLTPTTVLTGVTQLAATAAIAVAASSSA
jgi:alpha-tubulin suppressor-like RCC1 family protein